LEVLFKLVLILFGVVVLIIPAVSIIFSLESMWYSEAVFLVVCDPSMNEL